GRVAVRRRLRAVIVTSSRRNRPVTPGRVKGACLARDGIERIGMDVTERRWCVVAVMGLLAFAVTRAAAQPAPPAAPTTPAAPGTPPTAPPVPTTGTLTGVITAKS